MEIYFNMSRLHCQFLLPIFVHKAASEDAAFLCFVPIFVRFRNSPPDAAAPGARTRAILRILTNAPGLPLRETAPFVLWIQME